MQTSSSRVSDNTSVSVIIPAHEPNQAFQRCIASLSVVDPPPSEIIVVVDGNTDDSWQCAEDNGVEVLRLSVRGGPARARNAGASRARGEILFFLDSDVVVTIDCVGRVLTAFERDPDLAAVFGSYDDQPAATNFLSQYKNLFH